MRPTDEDQPGSKRPNLMSSSRRSSGDVNILAMLDGLGTRPRTRRTMLRYGVGGVLACALVGTLAWMMREAAPAAKQPTVAVELPAPAVARLTAPVAEAATQAATQVATQAAAPVPDAAPTLPAPSGGATIVNLPTLSGSDTRPQLAAAAAAPADPPRTVPAPKHASAHAPIPAHQASPAHPPARTNVAAARPGAHPAPKRAAASRNATAPAPMDTDVALISAIIQHAATRHDGAEDGACGDKPCGARTPARP